MKTYKKLTLCLLTLFSLVLLIFNFNIHAQADNNVSVHLNYIDAASGHKLQNDTTISGEVGTNLNIVPSKINGYSFKGSSELINGKFSKDTPSITMYYVPSSTNKDNDNSSLSKDNNSSNSNSSFVDNSNNEDKQQSSNKKPTVANYSNDTHKSESNIKSDGNSDKGNNNSLNSVNTEVSKSNQTPSKKNNVKDKNKHSSDNNIKNQENSNNNGVYIYTFICIIILAIIAIIYFVLRKKGKHFK